MDKFFENSQDMLCLAGMDGYFKVLNKRWSEVLGYSDKELLAGPFSDLIHPEDVAMTAKEVEKLSKGFPTVKFENRFRKKDGEYIWLSWTSTPDPETGELYSSARNITKDKRDEILLNDTERVAKIGGWELDVAQNTTFWTKGIFRIYGLPIPKDNTVSVTRAIDAYHPDDKDTITNAVNQCANLGKPWDLKSRLIRNNGDIIWVRAIGSAVKNANGEITHLRGVFHDINDQVIREEKIIELNRRFSSAINHAKIVLVDWHDVTKDYLWVSDTFLSVFGYTADEIKNSNSAFMELIHPDDLKRVNETLDKAIKNLKTFDIQLRMLHKSGEYKWMRVKAGPNKDPKTKKVGLVGIFSDFTRIKNYENSLKETNKELEQFAHVTSHDLKEPLKLINLFSDRILATEKDQLSPNGAVYLQKLQTSVKDMNLLINDLLLYSSIVNKQARFTDIKLQDIFDRAVEPMQEQLTELGGSINCMALPTIKGVKISWFQVFQNLISNSIKFRQKNKPLHIDVTYELYKNSVHKIVFVDNGIGFDANFSKRIFDPFKRLNPRDEYTGSGIGLAIVNKVVTSHAGEIIATSELGKGATMEIYLPVNFNGNQIEE